MWKNEQRKEKKLKGGRARKCAVFLESDQYTDDDDSDIAEV
jgi:hypothetical protein